MELILLSLLQKYADKRIGDRVGRRPLVPSSANGVSGERMIIILIWFFDDTVVTVVSRVQVACEMQASKSGRSVTIK